MLKSHKVMKSKSQKRAARTPSAFLMEKHQELLSFIEQSTHLLSVADIAALWQCSVSTAHTRIWNMRQSDLFVPPLRKADVGENHEYRLNAKILHTRGDYATIGESGDPSLPECPRCKKARRFAWNGSPVHLITDGKYIWCPRCAYEPQSD